MRGFRLRSKPDSLIDYAGVLFLLLSQASQRGGYIVFPKDLPAQVPSLTLSSRGQTRTLTQFLEETQTSVVMAWSRRVATRVASASVCEARAAGW